MVGWSKVDSVTQLASNHAGVRFLGLAAAMMSSMDPLEAAQVLTEMIRETAQDKRLVPTKKQLHDLWTVMTPRCSLSGFTDSVLSWGSQFIDSNTGRLIFCAQPYKARGTSPNGLQRLVEAFREISRIGDASVTKIRIQCAYENLPWLSAFTEWCLGVPPSITGHDGSIVQDYHDSPVSVSAVEALGHQQPFDITLYYVDNIPGPRQLVTADQHIELGGAIMTGMASLSEYGQYLRRLLGCRPGTSQVAFNHALPFAVHQCFKLLRFSSMSVFDHAATNPMKAWADADNGPMDEAMQNLTLSPFPDRHGRSVLHIMDLLFGLRNLPESLSSPSKEMLISEHPSVKAYLEDMQRSCTCYKCSGKNESFSECYQDTFYDDLSCIVADVLALGLFIGPDSLLVSLHRWFDTSIEAQSLKVAIKVILQKGEPVKSTIKALHMWSAYLTGYSFRPIDSTLLMSSGMGQTIWPSILDTRVIGKNGFLSLSWARGDLVFNGEKYELVHSSLDIDSMRPDKKPDFQRQRHIWGISEPVLRPMNTFPNIISRWEVAVGLTDLTADLSLNQPVHPLIATPRASPTKILQNLASGLILEHCQHDPQTPLSEADRFCSYATLGLSMELPLPQDPPAYSVIGVDGDQELQFFACAGANTATPIIIRKNACLSCCLSVGKRTGYPVIIL